MNSYKRQEFDDFAADYENILTDCIKKLSGFDSNYFCEYKVQAVKDSLSNLPINFQPKNILDFGCGEGTSCEFFRKHFPDAAITGIDVSEKSIEIARKKQIPNSNFVLYDGKQIPLKVDSFDLVFSACVFHHIEKHNHAFLIEQINKVLKQDGKLFIFEHNPLNPFARKIVKDCIFDKGVELIYPKSLKKIMLNSNFNNPQINYTLFFPRYKAFENLFFLEKHLKNFFIGVQYYIEASKTTIV